MGRRARRLLCFAVLAAAAMPLAATASHSCSDISILSRMHGTADEPAVNAHELAVCPTNSGADHAYDTRIIQPGANQIRIIYAPNPAPGPGSPPVNATLTSTIPGFAAGTYQLTSQPVVTGIYRYASAWISIPAGVHGSVTAVVAGAATTYHTVN